MSTADARLPDTGLPDAGLTDARLRAEIESFLVEEARLLDTARYGDWVALFAADGFYWVPAAPAQADPLNHISIIYEDKSVLELRVRRLGHPRAYGAQPIPRTAHLVGNVTLEAPAAGNDCACRSTVMVAEYRAGERRLLAGHQTHQLRRTPEGWRIALKRVDLIDCDAAHDILTVPI
jgi:benzoate/toluate 1,2-dioxygenase beta subunit